MFIVGLPKPQVMSYKILILSVCIIDCADKLASYLINIENNVKSIYGCQGLFILELYQKGKWWNIFQ